ncbi:MAG: aminoglycoside 6-adenylyltransferase [Lactobacillales bacterium]|jgi:aminoglycoside 6-adenylyltransferase|nr:aminoglycoside 6-adenylyltransferase [Lactobacillales bacterium]
MKRTESEMFTLIWQFVKKHPEIEIVGTEGSRNNPHVSPDEFQDFDITFFVSRPSHLIKFRNLDYEEIFGEITIFQSPSGIFEDDYGVVKMIQFTDGNRIDLKVRLLSSLSDYLNEDSLNHIVWGGEDRETSDLTWRVKSPTQDEFLECINEFYWVAIYVAKGIKRNQLIYANSTFELIR